MSTFEQEQSAVFTIEVDPPRRVDPLVIRRRLLQASRGRLFHMIEAAAAPAPGTIVEPDVIAARAEAGEQLLSVIRQAFDLPAFDGEQGIVEATAWRIWNEWCRWVTARPEQTGGEEHGA
jgi:hypothetical protein